MKKGNNLGKLFICAILAMALTGCSSGEDTTNTVGVGGFEDTTNTVGVGGFEDNNIINKDDRNEDDDTFINDNEINLAISSLLREELDELMKDIPYEIEAKYEYKADKIKGYNSVDEYIESIEDIIKIYINVENSRFKGYNEVSDLVGEVLINKYPNNKFDINLNIRRNGLIRVYVDADEEIGTIDLSIVYNDIALERDSDYDMYTSGYYAMVVEDSGLVYVDFHDSIGKDISFYESLASLYKERLYEKYGEHIKNIEIKETDAEYFSYTFKIREKQIEKVWDM